MPMHPTRLACRLAAAMLTMTALPAAAQAPDPASLDGLEWRTIGPAVVGGRITDLAVVETDPRIFYVATATGGLWKTTSHGAEWEPIFDDQPVSSIGDVTLAPSNPNVVWVGTGEANNRQSSPWGAGVYRSLDAGRTWTFLGLEHTRSIGRIVVHPRNPDIAWVAAGGNLWAPNEERGVYRTKDGGRTWEKVLYIDDLTGATDLVMDPGDPNTLFAAMYQRLRTAWGFNGGGPGSGIWRSLDGGDTWHELTEGLPKNDMGRIGLDVYRGDGSFVIASIEAFGDEQGIYATTDRGETWEKRSDTNQRPMYFSQMRIDPTDPERVYLGAVQLWISSDGGRTFEREANEVHPDFHALWIDPNDPHHIIAGVDGGLSVSFDRGENWRMYDNLPLAQFYEVGTDMRWPYYVCGGLQDNGSWCGPSNTLSSQGIRNADWYNIGGGDGFYAQIDPNDHTIVFAESQNGFVQRLDLTTGERLMIRPAERPRGPHGADVHEDSVDFRWNWNTPIRISHHDPAVVYLGSNVLLRSRDRGMSWEQASPDLTHDIDRDTLAIMGKKPAEGFLARHDGVSFYGTLTTLSESPVDANVIWTGADDGALHVTRDGGATWTEVSGNVPGLPARTYVSRVLASRTEPGVAYATFDGHYSGDFRPHVYVTRDFGSSWRRIVRGLPEWSVNVIAQHARAPNLLFVGSEVGVSFSIDGGANWAPLRSNLPTVPVDDIMIHPRDNDLIIGTHGRGVWIIDDIAPLEHLTPQVVASSAHLFPSAPAIMASWRGAQAWVPAEYSAPNPRPGARIRYWIGSGAAITDDGANGGGATSADSVTLTILDASGATVRTLKGPAEPGLNEIVWDFRLEPAFEIREGMVGVPTRMAQGPRVLPGTYRVRLDAAGQTSEQPLVVRADPRSRSSEADMRTRHALITRAFGLAEPLYRAGEALTAMREQVTKAQELLRDRDDAPSDLRDEARQLATDIGTLQRDFNEVRGSAGAASALEGWIGAPTEDAVWQVDRAWADAPDVVRRLNAMLTDRVPAFLRRIYQPGLVPELPEPVEMPAGGGTPGR